MQKKFRDVSFDSSLYQCEIYIAKCIIPERVRLKQFNNIPWLVMKGMDGTELNRIIFKKKKRNNNNDFQ